MLGISPQSFPSAFGKALIRRWYCLRGLLEMITRIVPFLVVSKPGSSTFAEKIEVNSFPWFALGGYLWRQPCWWRAHQEEAYIVNLQVNSGFILPVYGISHQQWCEYMQAFRLESSQKFPESSWAEEWSVPSWVWRWLCDMLDTWCFLLASWRGRCGCHLQSSSLGLVNSVNDAHVPCMAVGGALLDFAL